MSSNLKNKKLSFWYMIGGSFTNVSFSFIILFVMDTTFQEFSSTVSFPTNIHMVYLFISFLLTSIPNYFINELSFMKEVNNSGFNKQLFSFPLHKLAIIYLVLCSTEELLFRVAIQGTISGFINLPWTIGIVSLMFALMHIRYIKYWQLFLSSIWVSIVWGILYALTNSWVVVSLAHFAHNFILTSLHKSKN